MLTFPFHEPSCGAEQSHLLLVRRGGATPLKAKEFIYLLGLKPKPKTFGFVIEALDLTGEVRIEATRWTHPDAYRTTPTSIQAAVDQPRRLLPPSDFRIDMG